MNQFYATKELKRGGVYYITFDANDSGIKTGRPAIIVSDDSRNMAGYTVSIVYTTTSPKSGWWYPQIWSMKRPGFAVCPDLTVVKRENVGDYICTLTEAEMKAVERGILGCLGISFCDNDDLKAKNAELEAELRKKEVDCLVYQRSYEKVLDRLVEQRIDTDVAARGKYTPVVEEEPEFEDELIDLNTCTEGDLKRLALPLTVIRNITAARPYANVDELQVIPGVTRVMYQLLERKVTV